MNLDFVYIKFDERLQGTSGAMVARSTPNAEVLGSSPG